MWFDIAKRSEQQELLDGDDFDEADLRKNLREIELVNKRLGGHASSVTLLSNVLSKIDKDVCYIADLGCGSGDTLRVFAEKWPLNQYTGIDTNVTAIEMACQANHAVKVRYIAGDFFDQPLSFDIVHMGMVNHHLSWQQNVEILKKILASDVKYVVINDLHRNYLAWAGIGLLTHILPSSKMVRHDAPLSVRRAYNRNEWKGMIAEAGAKYFSINWAWAFRYLIIIENR